MSVHITFNTPYLQETIDTGNSIILIGIANNGPPHQAVLINSYDHLISVYGEGSSFISTYKAILGPELSNIYAIRINGSRAIATINYTRAGQELPGIYVYSNNAGSKYNDVLYAKVTTDALQLISEDSTVSYNLEGSLDKLCENINFDCRLGLHNFLVARTTSAGIDASTLVAREEPYPLQRGQDFILSTEIDEQDWDSTDTYMDTITWEPSVLTISLESSRDIKYITDLRITYTGDNTATCAIDTESLNLLNITLEKVPVEGDLIFLDGIVDANNRYITPMTIVYQGTAWSKCASIPCLLRETYNKHLFDLPFKIVTLSGIHYGNSVDYAKDLAAYCFQRNKEGAQCLGVISAAPIGVEKISDYVTRLNVYSQLYKQFYLDGIDDTGAYISIIAGEILIDEQPCTLEGAYSQLLNYYDAKYSITNKKLNTGTLVYELNAYSMRACKYPELLERYGGITSAVQTINRGICVFNGVTHALSPTFYSSLRNTRIAQTIVSKITALSEEEIGESSSSKRLISFNDKIDETLSTMVNEAYLRNYSYTIHETNLYDLIVEVNFVPVGDISSLYATVTI